MSERSVEAVRRWVDAYNGREIEELLALSDPEIEFRSIFAGLESGGAFRGRSGVYEYFAAIDEAYESFQVPPREFDDAGAAVLLTTNAVWKGRGSGAADETAIFVAVWLRFTKVMRVETFTDRETARAAVGLAQRPEA